MEGQVEGKPRVAEMLEGKKRGGWVCWRRRWWKKRERDTVRAQVGGYDEGGGTGETSNNVSNNSGLFYSRQVHEAEERIDRSTREEKVITDLPAGVLPCLAACLPTCLFAWSPAF